MIVVLALVRFLSLPVLGALVVIGNQHFLARLAAILVGSLVLMLSCLALADDPPANTNPEDF